MSPLLPTTTYKEVIEKLKQFSQIENVTEKDVSNAVKKNLLSGKFTFKKISRMAKELFTDAKMLYTQTNIDFVIQLNPRKVNFFDVKLSNWYVSRYLKNTSQQIIDAGNLRSDLYLNQNFSLTSQYLHYFHPFLF